MSLADSMFCDNVGTREIKRYEVVYGIAIVNHNELR
jgi:hypothetical protein